MNRDRLVIIVLIFSLLTSYILLEQSRNTTFKDVLSEYIDEGETVKRIRITRTFDSDKDSVSVKIFDEKIINNFLQQEIQLKKDIYADRYYLDHHLVIYTTTKSYWIPFDDESIIIGSNIYKVANPDEERLFAHLY